MLSGRPCGHQRGVCTPQRPINVPLHSFSSRAGRKLRAAAADAAAAERTPPPIYLCPACGNKCYGLDRGLIPHMSRCCGDLLAAEPPPAQLGTPLTMSPETASLGTGPQPPPAVVSQWLQDVAKAEHDLRLRALLLQHGPLDAFNDGAGAVSHERDDAPAAPPAPPAAVAAALGLPVNRTAKLLQFAARCIPLPASSDPVDIVFEDAAFVAVNKPPGVRSAPHHRFSDSSMVNRLIGYLGYPPHLLHRLDMDTSGALLSLYCRDSRLRTGYVLHCNVHSV